ncbi:MAG: hypothetical protein AAB019_10490 [Planctomycetota bacterium]
MGFIGLFKGYAVSTEPETNPTVIPVKPEDIIQEAFKNIAASEGYHIDSKFSLVLTGQAPLKKEGTIQFVYRNPNPAGGTTGLIHIITNWEEQEFESYQFIPSRPGETETNNQLINRHPLTNEWLPVMDSHLSTMTELYENIKGHLTNFQTKPPQKIQNNNCLVIQAIMNQAGQKKITETPPLPLPMQLNFQDILDNQFIFWIDEINRWPVRISFSLTISGDEFSELFPQAEEGVFEEEPRKIIVINFEMDFFNYNKNLDFTIPDEVKKLLNQERSDQKEENKIKK